ncbi:hypothetical protein SAMN02745857_03618 [Andreprevotia lacus DSM 23236]|jgi:hypothetical protein|uniref:Knr4/Smi1-like domain-containing protein n=1 Tax=Andreprevotia lacus DSM 23236 TaxID=1121001 RepID=A0A1W1Y002_9NEIS|nr:SMI1/KNR4 family protein [Andreprevotia lacus]SMC29121.1 hypothetical protein SAMN02745857_03618 [Andreprevotia lacus DSM 23236]
MNDRRRLLLIAAATTLASLGVGAYAVSRLRTDARRQAWQDARKDAYQKLQAQFPAPETDGMIARDGLAAFLRFWDAQMLLRLQRAPYTLDGQQRDILHSGSVLNPPASAGDIGALQDRLGVRLPPSMRALLALSNGIKATSDYANEKFDFLRCAQIDWLNHIDQGLIDIWNKEGFDATDAEYSVYGPKQDSVKIRARYMKHSIAISPVVDGGVYLLNPQITFADGEMEVWDFSVKLPGANRYQSLYPLLEIHCSNQCTELDGQHVDYLLKQQLGPIPPRT